MKWFLAVCSLVFAAALVTPSKTAHALSRDERKAEKSVRPATKLPRQDLVDRWFDLIEGALTDLSTTRGRWEDQKLPDGSSKRVFVEPGFGMNRIPMVQGHGVARDIRYMSRNRDHLTVLTEKGVELTMYGFGNGTTPLTKTNLRQTYFNYNPKGPNPQEVTKMIQESFDSIVEGATVFRKLGDWDVQTRLVRLNQKECLSCHIESKINDPAAIFAFASHEDKNDSDQPKASSF